MLEILFPTINYIIYNYNNSLILKTIILFVLTNIIFYFIYIVYHFFIYS